MRKFTLKPELSGENSHVVIPGVGRVAPKQVLAGEQFARFVPSLLVELLEEPKPAPLVPPPAPVKTLEAPLPPSKPLLVETQPEPKEEEPKSKTAAASSAAKKPTSTSKK